MFQEFLEFIEKQELCRPQDKILMAVSGGIDSMVMLDLFRRAGFNAGVIHCNFGLRGIDSDEDENLVKAIADRWGFPVYTKRFDTPGYAQSKGLSIQMAAREIRYGWFEQVREEKEYDYTAVAHHFNDSVETSIFNFIRGTGLKGLTGIPARTHRIIRPLIFAQKQDIIDYAERNSITYREDVSNKEVKYRRNYIRNKLIPLFEEINPNFIGRSATTLKRLSEAQDFIEKTLARNPDSILHKKGKDIYLSKSFIRNEGSASILYELIRDYGFNYTQAENIYEGIHGEPGLLFTSDTYRLNIDREDLILSPGEQDEKSEIHFYREESGKKIRNGILYKEEIGRGDIDSKGKPDTEFLDLDKINFPLKIRKWKEGDWFFPLGMRGKKKVSDFMIDEKIPVNLKKRVHVVLSGDSIIWIVGYRIDDRFKITSATKHVLKLIFKPFHD